MGRIISTMLIAGIALAGCGYVRDSALNPANWFGRSQSVPATAETGAVNPLIPRRVGLFGNNRNRNAEYTGIVFEQVTDLTVERVPGGAIIRATGLAARQGRYDVRLIPVTEDEAPVNGILAYRFEGVIPAQPTPVGQPQTREVTAARRLTDQELAGVREIRVEALQNARVARR